MADESVREMPQSTPPAGTAPAALPAPTGGGDALGATLRPWMKAFALWLLSPQPEGRRPSVSAQTKRASELAGYPITKEALRLTRKRPDFLLFLQTLHGSVTEAARESLTLAHRFYVESHQRGLEMALAAGDYKAVPAFTVPVLDRVAPRKADTQVGSKTIIVNVHEQTARQLMAGTDPGEVLVEAAELAGEDDGEAA